MPAFEYIAFNASGGEETGILEADNSRQVRQILRDGKLMPLEVTQVERSSEDGSQKKIKRAGRVSAIDLALLTRQLATLVESGSPLEEALKITAQQTEKPNIRRVMSAVRSRVVEGHTLASGMKSYPTIFPDMYTSTVAAGEKSGHLDKVLERLADYTETRQETQQRLGNALFYPVILTILSIIIVAGLVVFIVPKIRAVFDNIGQELPVMTKGLIALSDFLSAYGLYVLGGLVLLYILFKQLLKIPSWKRSYHKFLLKLPIVGKMTRGVNTARFARTLSILSSSGVPILNSMTIASEVIQNIPMKEAIQKAAIKVREGSAIHRAMEKSGYFPPMTVYLIASGESSGKLDQMLERAAIQQERETDSMLSKVLGLFEPLLILVMGLVVLLIVASILLPILNISA